MKRQTWSLEAPGKIIFGVGAVNNSSWVERLQWKRVLVITDPAIVRAGGIVERVQPGGFVQKILSTQFMEVVVCRAIVFDR